MKIIQPINPVAADVSPLHLILGKELEPTQVGCYGSGAQIASLGSSWNLSPGAREHLAPVLNDIGDFQANTVTRLLKNRRKILPLLEERAGVRASFGLITLFLFSAALVHAQTNYAIDWSTVDGGGGTSTSAVYAVTGTIGQPDAGKMTGGNYSIDGGFWGIVAAVQTPGSSLLTVTRSGSNVIVSWPSPSLGFTLQQNSSVVNSNGWSNFGGTVNSNATTLSVTLPSPTGNLFFRLKQ